MCLLSILGALGLIPSAALHQKGEELGMKMVEIQYMKFPKNQ